MKNHEAFRHHNEKEEKLAHKKIKVQGELALKLEPNRRKAFLQAANPFTFKALIHPRIMEEEEDGK